MLSMTGFSTTTITLRNTTFTMSLKSLNGRFFEANCKLPYALASLETEIIKLLKQKLKRGSVFFSLFSPTTTALKAPVQPSLSIIEGYLDAIHTIQNKYHLAGSISINDLVLLPNIFETPEEPLDEQTIEVIMHGIKKLIDDMTASRKQEGSALHDDLNERMRVIKKNLTELEPRAQVVQEERKKNLIASLQELFSEASVPLALETHMPFISNQLEKIDIHEEIVRFSAHLKNFLATMENSDEDKGKKLDFILQEMFREVNTMNAKCADSIISNLAIGIKVELEKSREQVQNLV